MKNSNVEFAKGYFMNLPPVTRGLITIAGVGIIVYAGYKIYKATSGKVDSVKTPEEGGKAEATSWDVIADQLNNKPSTKATITKAQASSYANSLFVAMDGYGTNEWGIVAIFNKLKNDADFALVQSAYGVRKLSSGAWNIFESDFTGNLNSALTNELSQSWKDKINQILQKRKIKFRV